MQKRTSHVRVGVALPEGGQVRWLEKMMPSLRANHVVQTRKIEPESISTISSI